MKQQKQIIHPIAIDLGSKNTGVYVAHYPAGTTLLAGKPGQLAQRGKVYSLAKDAYTLLMVERTQIRHQRRGIDRRKMVKRLFKLIWHKHFELPWDKDVQQSISFLLNRRGFTFLTEEYNPEHLHEFPQEAYELLPSEIKKTIEGYKDKAAPTYQLDLALTDWQSDATANEKITGLLNELMEKPKEIKKELAYVGRVTNLQEYCKIRSKEEKIPQEKKQEYYKIRSKEEKADLSRLAKWIFERMVSEGVKGLGVFPSDKKSYDLLKYLNEKPLETTQKIADSLPDLSELEKEKKASIWNFKDKFSLEKANFDFSAKDDQEKEKKEWLKTHLEHFAFALKKIANELTSGGRYRSKYFQEITDALSPKERTDAGKKKSQINQQINKDYLARFNEKLAQGEYKKLNKDNLCRLLGHLSNFELKPLRKYFHDKAHKKNDYWDESRLARIFENWILNEWRIDETKDKHKAVGKEGDYLKLKTQWQSLGFFKTKNQADKKEKRAHRWQKLEQEWQAEHRGKLIDFWCTTKPFLTIPPYQDNNNRRPPKCQSLILNHEYLDNKYPDWQNYLQQLIAVPSVKEYLGGFVDKLSELKSSSGSGYFGDKKESQQPESKKYHRPENEILARQLQLIFDRVKKNDPLMLNEIFSFVKKYRQLIKSQNDSDEIKQTLQDIAKVIEKSSLPAQLKTKINRKNDGLIPPKTFLHLVCQYYRLRQRGKQGRIFIHPEYRWPTTEGIRTGRFDHKAHLLKYCNYKPRQKRHQLVWDLASLFAVTPDAVKKVIDDHDKSVSNTSTQRGRSDAEKIVQWLDNLKDEERFLGLVSNCEKAAKEQKERRGYLRENIQRIYGLFYHYRKKHNIGKNEKLPEDAFEKLQKSTVNEAKKLYGLCERARKFHLKINEVFCESSNQKKLTDKELMKNPARSVFFLAQLYNIAFKDRSGNSNTCVVCSADNAHRMEIDETAKNQSAKAQRLAAIEMRQFDGAIKRMARIISGAIVKDEWQKIEEELQAGWHVHLPIITESNRFEFEPSLREIKKKIKKEDAAKIRKKPDTIFATKDNRIKKASGGICPYSGKTLGDDDEIDHIIPRASKKYGTLNDEANLIYASKDENEKKKNDEYSLQRLAQNYKKNIFKNLADDAAITRWIVERIDDDTSEEDFKFGKYRSFINLNSDEQKAFRHALFLNRDHPLRKKVLAAIDNRNRTFVNGTQRYFAQAIADNFHKKFLCLQKKDKNMSGKLSFDYFGVEAGTISRDVGIHELREKYETAQLEKFKDFKKKKGETQDPYSHLLDAHFAFMIIADKHKNDGSIKLNIPDNISLKPAKKGEKTAPDLFSLIEVDATDCETLQLKRRKTSPDFFEHKTFFDANPRSWHFLKLIELEIDNVPFYLQGFLHLGKLRECLHAENWQDSLAKSYGMQSKSKFLPFGNLITHPKKLKKILAIYSIINNPDATPRFGYVKEIIKNTTIRQKNISIRLYQLDKQAVASFLLNNFNTNTPPKIWETKNIEIYDALQKLWYFTKRKGSFSELKDLDYQLTDITNKNFLNPQLLLAWQNIHEDWQKTKDDYLNEDGKYNLGKFAKKHFKIKKIHKHQRVRKSFALPKKATGQGFMLIKRKSWNEQIVYQCQAEKSGTAGVGRYTKRVDSSGKSYDSLTPYYRGKNIVLLVELSKLKDYLRKEGKIIDSEKWFPFKIPPVFTSQIESIDNQFQSKGDSNWKIIFKKDPEMADLIELMYGGYHIDELHIGGNPTEKTKLMKYATDFFTKENKKEQYLTIEEATEKLQGVIDDAVERKIKIEKGLDNFVKCWTKCLKGITGRELRYKRNVKVKI